MGTESTGRQSFGAGVNLYVAFGFLLVLFAGIGVAIGVQQGDWTAAGIAGGAAIVVVLLLQVIRLEVCPDGFRYRNLSGSRSVALADIRRAYFEVVRAEAGPRPAVAFWVQSQDGRRVKVNLRTLPVRAAATLFAALEAGGIPIEVPDDPAAKRVNDEVRAAQASSRVGERHAEPGAAADGGA